MKRYASALLLLALTFGSSPSRAKDAEGKRHSIRTVELKGFEKSKVDWLEAYLPLDCPCELTDRDLTMLRSKLLTTQVFQTVDFRLEPLPEGGETLTIDVLEKWTVIPVVRGAIGGGTPLLVAGIYDSHFLGRLYTLGAETRTYGKAPTGGVAWFRAPRWKEGKHAFNFEIWRDNRIRSLFDEQDEEYASLYGSALAGVAEFLMPVPALSPGWQAGLRVQYRDQQHLNWYEEPETSGVSYDFTRERNIKPLLRLIYDDVAVAQLNMQGLRSIISLGPSLGDHKPRGYFEQELYYYLIFGEDWNLGLHQWLGITSDRSYQSLFFLGGFDSIRGIPDGVLYGNKALYGNIELRRLFERTRYAWWQAAAYFDFGTASMDEDDLQSEGRKSAGVGLRIAIPQVHRLMFRIDYAWGLDGNRDSSVSAGLNQFFDPYRPL